MEDEKIEVKNEGYFLGIIGAIIGGLICSLPWILSYVYLNFMWSMLAAVIAFGAFKGYELMKGKMDKKVPYIIAIITVLCAMLSILVIIPTLLLMNKGMGSPLDVLPILYSDSEFRWAILKDALFGLFFSILGVAGIFKTLLNQAKLGEKLTLKK